MDHVKVDLDKHRGKLSDFSPVLTSKFCLNYGHINARSVPAHIDEITNLLVSQKMDVFGVSETFLKRGARSATHFVKGFDIFRSDRVGSECGGVAVYVRKGIKVKVIERNEPGARIEFIMTELILCGARILVVVVYIPPPTTNSDVDHLLNILSVSTSQYSHVVLMGDFNINTSNLTKAKYFLSAMSSLALCRIPYEATRMDASLDHIFVNDASVKRVLKFAQSHMPGISDHDALFLRYNHRLPTPPIQYKLIKSTSQINTSLLDRHVREIPWSRIYCMQDSNDQIAFLTQAIDHLYQKTVPVKRVIEKPASVPWFDANILHWMQKRDAAYSMWLCDRSVENRSVFSRFRNKVVTLIRDAKRRYYFKKFSNVSGSQQAWRALKNLGFENNSKTPCSVPVDELNSHFLSMPKTSTSIPLPSKEGYQETDNAFSFISASESEVLRAVYSIASDSPGIDGISLKFLKIILPHILPYLTHALNHCITSCCFPESWKQAMVVPVPKVLTPVTKNDYRPISLLSILSKVLEIIIRDQIQSHLDKHNLLSSKQSGFRKQHSTTTALSKISYDILQQLNNSRFTVLILLDFSKAFDSVNHQLLCQRLFFDFGFSHLSIRFIHSYLTGRSQSVRVGDTISTFKPVLSGVPQGSILGPLLFSLFINDLPQAFISSDCHLYADDCQLYLSGDHENIDETFKLINTDLRHVAEWTDRNGLVLNAKKTQALFITRRSRNVALPELSLNGVVVKFSETIKNLGVIFNSTFNWNDHANAVCNKVNYALHSLRQLNFYTPKNIKLLLVRSLIVPFFTYCDVLYYNADYISRRRLQVSFNSCLRYIHNLGRYDHISIYSDSILGLSLFDYLKFRVCVFIFKLIHLRHPSYLSTLISFGTSARTFNITSLCERGVSRQYTSSMFVNGFSLWNSLPLETKRAGSVGQFRSSCFKYFSNTGCA